MNSRHFFASNGKFAFCFAFSAITLVSQNFCERVFSFQRLSNSIYSNIGYLIELIFTFCTCASSFERQYFTLQAPSSSQNSYRIVFFRSCLGQAARKQYAKDLLVALAEFFRAERVYQGIHRRIQKTHPVGGDGIIFWQLMPH